jgi:serine/threonine protein kinase
MSPKDDIEWKLLGSGRNSDVFCATDAASGLTIAVKVSYYREPTLEAFARLARAGRLADARLVKRRDAVSVNAAMGLIGNSMMRRGISPHFVTQFATVDIKNFYTKISHMVDRKVSRIQQKYTNLTFMEKFDCDLTRFLTSRRRSDDTYRAIIFQVVYTLAALQSRYPGFRHNDLSTNNVLVRQERVRKTWAYAVPAVDTFRPTFSARVALSDYDFAVVPSRLDNERVSDGHFSVDSSPNTSYDSHFFLKSVAKCIAIAGSKAPQTRRFLKSLGLRRRDRLTRATEPMPALEPTTLLRHPYFAKLRARRKLVRPTRSFAF